MMLTCQLLPAAVEAAVEAADSVDSAVAAEWAAPVVAHPVAAHPVAPHQVAADSVAPVPRRQHK